MVDQWIDDQVSYKTVVFHNGSLTDHDASKKMIVNGGFERFISGLEWLIQLICNKTKMDNQRLIMLGWSIQLLVKHPEQIARLPTPLRHH